MNESSSKYIDWYIRKVVTARWKIVSYRPQKLFDGIDSFVFGGSYWFQSDFIY